MKSFLFVLSFLLVSVSVVASLPVKVGTSYPSQSAFVMGTGEQLSGQQFQTDGIISYKGYQYTVYYNINRNVCIARRKMPVGAWEEIVLPYRNTVNDAHNTISIGISEGDGRIHLSYDHHNDPLRYCYSIVGSANNPEKMPWEAESFSPTTDIMDKAIPNVTYPRFISMPNGNLLFECRFRWSGFGDSYLREYDANTQTWSLIGRYIQGEDVTPDACAYINGMSYDHLGRIHITWCWRDDFGGGSNHDFYYAYSEDHGRTWKDTHGDQKASTDVMDPVVDKVTRNALGQTKKSYMVEAIPFNRGYINQETQDVDSRGRIHAVNSHIPDGQSSDSNWGSSRTKARLHHRFRKEDGTWIKRMITVNGQSVNSTRRVHLAIDSYDNAYVIANGYGVIMASPDDDYASWRLVSQDGRTGYLSEPLVDKPQLRKNGVLSFVYLSSDNKIAVYDYLTKNPTVPSGTGLLAEYFTNDNHTGLIRSEVVLTPLHGQVPIGTKSIRWSGAFETIEAEKYSLHLTTVAATRLFVNDRLLADITAGSKQTTVDYAVIPSHKNNIVIETFGAAAVSLAWSSTSVQQQNIPGSSLHPKRANDLPGNVTPPVLPIKAQLEQSLLSKKKVFNTQEQNVSSLIPFNPTGDYSLEINAKVTSAEGRGLDVQARAHSGLGFRFTVEPGRLTDYRVLAAGNELAMIDNSQEQRYRFVVKDNKVYVYNYQTYLGSTDLAMIGDIQTDNSELPAIPVYGSDRMSQWAGPNGSGSGRPTEYGWSASSASIPWNTAGAPGGVRYEEVSHALETGGTFTGRLMTMRWDNAAYVTASYFYPVVLEASTMYELSFLYEYWANASTSQVITAGISTSANATNRYHSQSFTTSAIAQRLRKAEFRFQSREAGTYYLTFNGNHAMYGIGDFQLRSIKFDNQLLVGKNYTGGSLVAEISQVNYEGGAFAPDVLSATIPASASSGALVGTYGNELRITRLPLGARVSVTDITGRIVMSQYVNSTEFNLILAKGIYLVGINNDRLKILM
jgi:hypothetical protein